jgi:hypothetical protein
VFRTSDIVLIAIMVSAAAVTYKIKADAETQQAIVRRIQAQIRTEEDTIDLLKADWGLLSQPARLERLTELYKNQLKLEPVDPHQFVKLGELPARPLTIEDLTAQAPDDMADNGAANGADSRRDATVTGAVQ